MVVMPGGTETGEVGYLAWREHFVDGAARLPQLHYVVFRPAEHQRTK